MNTLDYTKIERPVEPAFENEDPEGWCEVLAWEEARADKAEKDNTELREALNQMIEQFESDHNCEYEYKIIKASKQLLNK